MVKTMTTKMIKQVCIILALPVLFVLSNCGHETDGKFGGATMPQTSLADALVWLGTNAGDGGEYVYTAAHDESLTSKEFSFGSKTVKLTLKGDWTERIITLRGDGPLFYGTNARVTLVLDNNITLQGHGNNNNALLMFEYGNLVMNAGAKITGNNNTFYRGSGGAVLILADGVFTMNGGTISANSAQFGGGVCVKEGKFTMYGGLISDNNAPSGASSESVGNGGGVDIAFGTFIMNGGAIQNNSAAAYGGGVRVLSLDGQTAQFTQNGGTISANSAPLGPNVYIYTPEGVTTKNRGGRE